MKLFEELDKLVDKVIVASKPIQQLAAAVGTVAVTLEKLAADVAVIAHNQDVHQHVIRQIWNIQQQIFAQLADRTVNVKMPDIDLTNDGKQDDAKDQAVIDRKKAALKPN